MTHARSSASGAASASRRRSFLSRLWRSKRGSVTIEFVIIFPLMALILTGFVEAYMYLRAVSVLEHATFTLADSLGQMPRVINDNSTSNANNLGSLWSAATLLAAPNTINGQGAVIITSVCDTNATTCVLPPGKPGTDPGKAVVHWRASAPWNLSGLTTKVSSTAPLPSTWPFRAGDSAIIVEIYYQFNPFAMTSAFWKNSVGTQTLYQRIYVRSRTGQPLDLASS
ncbi:MULTISPECIES: TadE/TadG family type IV pilus assembly protein [unclassified Caballeronia]|uniref:TadE/TadG family type IV pilus assembly protein n=1 Tax=unclassified Caballeronia TaxID=2646786 RepID=UPI001FD1A0B7|nr:MULTISPECIES: TadE/TadG family type IV pilus assembly protein [unclassified Caballeronia]